MSDRAIDDTAQGMPLTPATAAAVSLSRLGRDKTKPAPFATCPRDGEPLIPTFERRGAEFLCMICGDWLGFLSPTPRDETPELRARYTELKAQFDAGERP